MGRLLLVLGLALCVGWAAAERAAVGLDGAWQCVAELAPASETLQLPAEWPGTASLPDRRADPKAPEAAVWYRRAVTLPGSGEVTGQLCFDHPVGRIDAFLNGVPLGGFAGNGLPQRLPVRGLGGATLSLAVRVAPASWRAAECGPGPMRLELLPATRIDGLFPVFDPGGKALQVRYRLATASPVTAELRLEAVTAATGRQAARRTLTAPLAPGTTDGVVRLTVNSVQAWSPDQPAAGYRLRATLLVAGQETDARAVPCGAALVRSRGGLLQINGAPVQLRGLRMSGHAPTAGACAPAEQYRRDMQSLRQAGFNAVMTDGPAPSELLLSSADAAGVYVIVSAPPAADGRPDLRGTVDAFGQHPCVIAWSGATAEEAVPAEVLAADPSRLLFLRGGQDSLLRAPGNVLLRCADLTVDGAAPARWWEALGALESRHLPVLASDLSVSPAGPDGERAGLAMLRTMIESLRRTTEFSLLGYFVRLPQGDTPAGLCSLLQVPTWAYVTAQAFNHPLLLTLRVIPPAAPDQHPQAAAAIISDTRLDATYQLYQVITTLNDSMTTITKHDLLLTGKGLVHRLDNTLTLPLPAAGAYRLQLILARGADVLASTQVVEVTETARP